MLRILKEISRKITRPELRDALRAAETVARQRLEARSDIDVPSILDACEIPDALRARASTLLETIASVLAIPVGKLRADDVLSEILSVSAAELSAEHAEALRENNFGRITEVFWYDLQDALWSRLNESVLEDQIRLEYGQLPRGEDGYIELIRSFRVRRLIQLFAPATVAESGST